MYLCFSKDEYSQLIVSVSSGALFKLFEFFVKIVDTESLKIQFSCHALKYPWCLSMISLFKIFFKNHWFPCIKLKSLEKDWVKRGQKKIDWEMKFGLGMDSIENKKHDSDFPPHC